MITPTTNQIEKLAKDYDIIPICKEIYADIITPISLLRRIAQGDSRCFLLESIEGGEKWARYSFLGFDPLVRIFCKNGVVTLEDSGVETRLEQDPYEALRGLMEHCRSPKQKDMPPFTGGLVGYFAYRMIGYAEPVLKLSGAPKIRACEIIEETEKEARGIYGGALDYIDFTGNMDTCIAIRMAVKKSNKVSVQAGGGIVADSVPESEYLESENKAKAIMQAVITAGEVDD